VRNHQFHLIGNNPGLFQHGFPGSDHRVDGELEHLFAFHMNEMQMSLERLLRRRHPAAAGGHLEDVAIAAIGVKIAGDHAVGTVFLGILQQNRTGAVAEKHAGVAVRPVGDAGKLLRTADQNVFVLLRVRFHQGIRHFERVEQSGAGGFKVEAERAFRTEPVLQNAPGARKHKVGSDRSDDDRIDFFSGNAGRVERLAARFVGQVAGRLLGRGNPALFDSGTGANPLVIGLDHLFEIRIA